MAILQSCCCWRTVRRGSFASAIYTASYFSFTIVMMTLFLHDERQYLTSEHKTPHGTSFLEPETISPTTIVFSVVVLCCSTCGLFSSLLLIYGLYKDNRFLLIPWICNVMVYTFVDVTHSLYILVVETLRFNPVTAILFTMDFFLLSLHVYALLCVVSQYQEYRAGRGTAEYDLHNGIPSVQYTAPTTATSISGMRRAVTYHETRPTPTQSPTIANTSLCTNADDSAPSSRRPSRKHVQFPDQNSTTKSERGDSSVLENDEPWTIDLKMPMLMPPD